MTNSPTRTPFCTSSDFERMKAARRRELERQGRPVPATLLPSEPSESDTTDQQPLTFDDSTEATR